MPDTLDHGTRLGVDVNELYSLAGNIMPIVGYVNKAKNVIQSCKPPAVDDRWTSMDPKWLELKSFVVDVLGDTAKNLTDAATGLKQAADNYLATDRAAAAEFHRLQQPEHGR